MRAIFDVGANDGSHGIGFARKHPDITVYAFEPTPRLVDVIKSRIRDEGIRNLVVVPVAVSDIEGTLKFNVAGKGDWGTSSLLEFSDGLELTWPGRKDLVVTEVIDVTAIRLDRFIRENGITSIEYLHCDTQGTDLKVLASLGEYIGIVRRGVIESATSRDVTLYKGQHTLEDVVLFFLQNALEVERIKGSPKNNFNEINVYFRQRVRRAAA